MSMTDLERVTNQRDYNRRLADHQKAVIDCLNAEITAMQDDARNKRVALIAADELAAEVGQLSDRLRQYEADGCDCEESNREYLGHVTPPLARTEFALSAYRAATGAE